MSTCCTASACTRLTCESEQQALQRLPIAACTVCLQVQAEKAFVLGMAERGRAVVHDTACEGMRECGEGDVDASCHWSTDGRYMCLRCYDWWHN